MPEEHLKVAIIDVVGILGNAGIYELLQFALQTEAVDIHLHVVRDLAGPDAPAAEDAVLLFFFSFVRVEAEILAPCVQKTQRHGLKAVVDRVVMSFRLRGACVRSEQLSVPVPHL